MMGLWNLRSLLLAVVVIINCIPWTASRHHFTHNVSGHRSRHRRQGAGLYLSASYVIPGGEGSGAWGEWGEVTACSRTCGGGVASQKRICLEVGPDGQPRCAGGDTKYFSCETQDCPPGSMDFRSQQCAEHDDEIFRGVKKYSWVPYTEGPNPCELNCMPKGDRFYYRHKAKVVDGTRCNDKSFDVCVDGTCQPVGCDMMLGSNAREDKCRECRGNNTNCHTISGTIDPDQDLRQGYNDILFIPQGATNIYIAENRNSGNYLALRSKEDNVYYLNGDYHIDFPRTLTIAGALWDYERRQQGFAAPDILRCQGPTTEPLYLSILLLEKNVGIEYEYSIPTALAPPPNQQYNWVHDEFSQCTASCGGGFQTRTVTCRSREELEVVDESLCDSALRPAINQSCNTQECSAQWIEGPWSACSKPCGEGGSRSRQVHCQKITNGSPTIVADKECFKLLGPKDKPDLYEECNKEAVCPQWYTGPWKPCDKLCGEGEQTRQVVCYQKIDGRVEVLADDECTEEKPPEEQGCMLYPCDGVDWVVSEWSGCDTCLSTVRTRSAECATAHREVVNASFCSFHPAPILEEPCDRTLLPACEVQWYATQWSNCSVSCGEGLQTRRVFCGMFDGSSVLKVDDNRCDNETRYKESKPCEVPPEKCPAKWFAGPWSECDKECGGGEQTRLVTCLFGGKQVDKCVGENMLDDTQSCNKGPCDKDDLIPVDAKATTIMDEDYEYDDCEEEDYSEVGVEEEETKTSMDDMMFSDTPFTTAEGSGEDTSAVTDIESEFTDTGSGSEPTITESSIAESSGTGPTESLGTDETAETGTIETEETGPTESTVTTESSATDESSETSDSSGTTESSGTSESSATDESSVDSESSGTTDTSPTEEFSATTEYSGTSESSGTSELDTSESDTTDSSVSTISSDLPSTTESSDATESSSLTDTSEISESSSSESSSTTEFTDSTELSTTESGATETGSTESGSTDFSTTDSSTTESGSTDTSVTESSESTESTESGATEETGSTESAGSEGSTAESGTESTSITETGSEETGSTESTVTSETEGTTESGATDTGATETGSTETGSTESGGTGTGSTEVSSTETGSTESEATEATETTESGATEETGSTLDYSTTELSTIEESTISGGSTPWDWESTVQVYTTPSGKRCKPRKKSKCIKSTFGCCPDHRTPAKGPFDEGCPHPKTCKESKHGCCPDDVSPATGAKNQGCPVVPCKETLFGCCKSDNKTAAEGNDEEGCPPPPPPCKTSKYGCCKDGETEAKGPKKKGCPETEPKKVKKGCADSKFGCCHDNKTEATGPNEEGCPCNVSEFGCCPDGVSPARGIQMEGCVMSCNTSAYGCCPDGETPAHGPEFEGCCLRYPYGCCPDNYKPADGPHLEGCGCQYAKYGCCPDNVTITRGPYNEGCGCQYTEHGCCPDRHTEATGPDFEGCDCHTYQFGCCPDGSTVAKGPNLQGCHCQHSKYGCCGDGQTAAAGPEQVGCDCSSSKYGCCPDGQTEAKGQKFLGCTDIPENRQAACSLSTDRGSCRNYSVYWYYDLEYGGCSRFWYGGCEGNGNRFNSKEECEDVCVQPPPKDACKLPKVKGACVGYHLRWYYDSAREQCGQFVFGGCLGNANNFDTRELCQERCEPARSEDQCKLPIERGSCAGNFGRWGFNAETRRCEQFIWGGCEGNSNRFGSEAACIMRCNPPGALQPECLEQQDVGNCSEKHAVWSFSQTENRCVPFYYTGCGGNGNRFDSEQNCAQSCPSSYVHDLCTLPAVTGDCADYRERWYYDTAAKRCRQFYYGGCGGNENNFASELECQGRCTEQRVTTVATPQPAPQQPSGQDFCFLEKDPGPCSQSETRWAYDSALGACTNFVYGGCGGNRNNFPSLEYCQFYCNTTQDICQLPMRAGPCDASLMRWFYDPVSDSCSQFTYGGCDGNDNRFDTAEECERRCRSTQLAPTTAITPTTGARTRQPEAIPAECQVSPSLEECSPEAGEVWYYEPSRYECVPHRNADAGAGCRRTGIFQSEEACLRSCGVFRNLDVCRYPVDPGTCDSFVTKFHYNSATGGCEQFAYGGCQGGPNRFSTENECKQICMPESDPCKQRPDPGNCSEYFAKWYYEESRDECLQFVYGGCNGNDNRFDSREECEGMCRKQPPAQETTTTQSPFTPPPQAIPEQCQLPDTLIVPCGSRVPAYYYDPNQHACVMAEIGSCGYLNTYRSEEECERNCGAFRGLDVCGSPLDPGPCRASIQKVYYDGATGRCQPFAYGGCRGGPNRFSTVDECENVCGGTGPDPSCLQAVDTGTPCGELAQGRWYYSTYRGECIRFVYSGCGGNDNNFVSIQQCEGLCKTRASDPEIRGNEVLPDCDRYNEECASLQCQYSIQRTRTSEGCERCSCVQVEIDCEPLRQECERLKCNYGMERTRGADSCERCRCIDHPCASKVCPPEERCVATAFRDPETQEARYSADCRTMNKPGVCPSEELYPTESSQCRRECNDDADCRGPGKCCERGCSQLCLDPSSATTPAPYTTTYTPELPQAPQAAAETEPEVTSEEGGMATLRCLFHGNPPPKITWRRGEITIDGTVGRYRLLSDGALEIISLYRNDSGVYICVADNGLGTARQEIRLQVNDPVEGPAGISGDPNAVVTGELGRSLNIRCLTFGYPEPSIAWYRGFSGPSESMVPFSSPLYEARGNVLQIRQLNAQTLGKYTCQAYNGRGKPAAWSVMVQAYNPYDGSDSPYYVQQESVVVVTPRERLTDPTTIQTAQPPPPPPEIEVPVYTVPVKTRILADSSTISPGSDLSLPCEVDGYPVPDVYWSKDGERLTPSDRMEITDARLTIRALTTDDSGAYGCHATNPYSSYSSTVQIDVRGLYIPAKCTDNPFFANCHLIVRSKYCNHKYYSKFCCKSCVEAGQLNPSELDMQADETWREKKK